ncbi:MAG: hypothetical protein A2736_00460 [Candidatus Yanofskybacteria bacterium RIFCSPHIGHO2_01_FULL_41_27]|uniref:Uncharacterized protein n=2 Tax=Candidatus Yanofskyibacteriota TaxID=1752733 RepID=A0A1F8HX16_9BACT|nr:MAG: hypothetical protein A2736_00460 [Candidatus Yanofskybacteria bacterium RIFCSPHIGHO2_01_FULL_41_27]OGN10015.1 MAG: hypothetical protein A3C64_01020 [Candidatus Yanofskybacteria bacterium RIFCSPHIGHO2_02_FULL_41_12]OGN41688.1 MAG: hypothetical protein A2606_02920 [Candidatus Yanofskybacteria bacterium RIFOXYD1_FULL_42_10]
MAQPQHGDVLESGHWQVTEDFGSPFFFDHTFPCPICRKNNALHFINMRIFLPCDDCRAKGFLTIKINPKSQFAKWILGIGRRSPTKSILCIDEIS